MTLLAALLALFAQAPEPPRCTAANSVDTTIEQIQHTPDRYLDRCVRATGLFSSIRLFSSRESIYLTTRFDGDGNYIPANDRYRIGVDNQAMRNLRLRAPTRATVIGRVDSCERRAQRIEAAGGIPFLGGYCHYYDGPTIVVVDYRLEGGRFERLTGEAARGRFGNIAPMPNDWPHRATLETFAADFLAALRSGDRARMAELHDVRPDTSHSHDRQMLAMLFDEQASPFTELRTRAAPQTAIFVTMRGRRLGEAEPEDEPSGTLCFCRTEDCTDRWPIAHLDVDNAPDRPYVCTVVEPRDWTARRAGLRTPTSESGFLAEPIRTAFRR